jgi:Ca2+-binding EF-hand superfamily protein
MKYRILFVTVAAALASWCAAADPPPRPATDGQDLVVFAESRPILVRLHVRLNGKSLEAVWGEYMGEVFKYLDTDGDGVLSKEEAERTPPPQVLFNNGGGFIGNFAPPSLAALDADKDGKVSKEELMSYYRRNGSGPFQVRFGQASDDVQLRRYRARLAGLQGQGEPSANVLNEALFKLLDTNGDGKLSKEELAAAPQVLAKLDVDDDEMITTQELLPGSGTGTGGGVAFAVALAMPATAPPANPLVMAVTPGESGANLARQLLERYGSKRQTEGSKTLTRQDLGLDKATFDRLDADGDGVLDSEELARFADRPPDVEVSVRLGRRGSEEPAVELVSPKDRPGPLAANLRTTKEGTVALDLGNTRIDLHAVSNTGPQVIRVQQLRQQYIAQFKAADRDNNGYLDMNEAQASPFFRNLFKVMDRDGDGKLFEKEMLAYLDAMQDLQTKAMATCASLNVSDQGTGLFDLLDTDHDGRLSVRELRNAVKLIEELDRDGDGAISRNEIPRNYSLAVQQGPGGGGNGFGPQVLVVNAFGGAPQRPVAQRNRGPLWFRKMDRNQDGDVSRREFLGSDEEFKRIDADGDGLISVEEAERYDALIRKQKDQGR